MKLKHINSPAIEHQPSPDDPRGVCSVPVSAISGIDKICYFGCMNEHLKCARYFCEFVKHSCIPWSTVASEAQVHMW